jgi:hypothetical protein
MQQHHTVGLAVAAAAVRRSIIGTAVGVAITWEGTNRLSERELLASAHGTRRAVLMVLRSHNYKFYSMSLCFSVLFWCFVVPS